MTDETQDPQFERALRAVLDELAPADLPTGLRDAVARVPASRPARRRWSSAVRVAGALALAAVVVVALAALATSVRAPGDLSGIGSELTPPPSDPSDLRLEYVVAPAAVGEATPDDLRAIVAILQARLDAAGVAGGSVSVEADGTIAVDTAVPATDVETTNEIRALLGATGRLEFVPLGSEPATAGQVIDLEAHPPLFSGDQVAEASLGTDQNGQRTVDFTLRPDGASLFAEHTAAHTGEFFAITLDGVVISAPVINAPIPNGEVQISQGGIDGYPLDEAQRLVTILSSGALPFPLREVIPEPEGP
jgi:preprotein translocase subunit SecD